MLKLLELFWTFLKIGLFTIGGGYAMIPMIESEVISRGWLTETELVNFLAISESTPGPFAINMATFVGVSQAGIIGGIFTTLGVITPSIVIIIAIFKIYEKFISNKYVQAAMNGIKAVVCGMIFFIAIELLLKELFKTVDTNIVFDYKALIILVILVGLKLIFKKKLNPIILILVSAVLGIIAYGVF
ncbi:MAG: chromate transporter [Bacilli bacterium]|nr:chromate transporter [Bacilli bacterium]